jgi:MFS family permease
VLSASFYAFVTYAFALQIVPPLMKTIILEFEINHSQAGLLMSMVVIPGILLSIPAGILTDRYGIKLTGIISTFMIFLGCFITAFASSFHFFLVGRFVLGFGATFLVTTMPSVISQWFQPKELGKAMGIFGMNVPLASIIAFLSASILMLNYNWRYPFYISAALALLSIIIYPLLVREGPHKIEDQVTVNVRSVLTSKEIWKVGIIWLLFNAAALSFTTWSPKIFEDFQNLDPFYASFLAIMLMVAAIPFVPIFGWISDKIARRQPLMVIGCTLMAIAFTFIAYTSGTLMIISIVALGISAALVPPMVNVLPPLILGPNSSGTGFGIIGICLNTGIAIAPPFIGLIIDAETSSPPIFLVMAIFSALAAVVAYTLKTR